MRWLYVAIILLLATATLIFALQNLEIVSVDFLWISMSAPLAFVVAATYVAGMATGSSFLALVRRSVQSAGMSRVQILISTLVALILVAILLAIVES
jgi:putative membrane protein